METITHEGKTYSKHPATNLCIGCDFWNFFGEHHECHAPNELQCGSSIYKEVTEVENYADAYDFENETMTKDDVLLVLKLILSAILIIALAIGSFVAAAYIIINNYK